jgi:phage tail-like protein
MPDSTLHTTSAFVMEMDGVTMMSCKSVSGIESETEIIEHKEATKSGQLIIRKAAGAMKWADIVLSKHVDASTDLWQWRKQVEDGDIDGARRNGSIVLYDSTKQEVARWNFENGWPSKWKGADLDAGEDAIALEEVTITHEGLRRA